MIKTLIFTAASLLLPLVLTAQVEKRVEITKTYVPSVGEAAKLPVAPDMTDTIKMQPDIDYSVTPKALATELTTNTIRPATVTYWDFNRPLPFYLKVGAGYPANSVLDFYVSTQNPDIGYAMGYINHEGRYAKIPNTWGDKFNSTRMLNRIGVAAGRYLGKHILEADLNYENRLDHRYGYDADWTVSELFSAQRIDDCVNYGEYNAHIRFGDDFKDLSRTNFNIGIYGSHFRDNSIPFVPLVDGWSISTPYAFEDADKGRQNDFGAEAALARAFGRHTLSAKLTYDGKWGVAAPYSRRENIVGASLRYGYTGGIVTFEVGADYYYDDCSFEGTTRLNTIPLEGPEIGEVTDRLTSHYFVPVAKIRLNLARGAVCLFADVSGRFEPNDFRSLSHVNPYVDQWNFASTGAMKSTLSYDIRYGIEGKSAKGRFSYRLYGGSSFVKNYDFWLSRYYLYFSVEQGRLNIFSINGEMEYKPLSGLTFMIEAHGYSYNKNKTYAIGRPAFEGEFRARYDIRKFSFGVRLEMQSVRYFDSNFFQSENGVVESGVVQLPFSADLGVDINWRVSKKITVFAEGRNLADSKIYKWPYYREYGPNFTLGIKAYF